MEKISVAIRVRPLSKQEVAKGSSWKIASNTINLCNATGSIVPGASYTFDRVFDTESKTREIYEARTKDIIASTVGGFNGTVFAYGQTSSGKTFTMRGSQAESGIIPLAVQDVFQNIQEAEDREFLLRVSYMEIYNEEINDLLAPENRKLQVHENLERGIFVAGLREEIVVSPEQVIQLMEFGEAHRHVGETNMNTYSSRSHTIFRMVIESRDRSHDDPAGATVLQVCDAVRVSVLNLVDLAGSERVAKTGAEGARLKEGSHINKSLMTLGNVINKLSEGIENMGGHVPYRDSKLTRILQPALGGNSKTAIICNVTPAWAHVDETKGTLQFASRAIRVTNCAQVNEVMTDAALLKRQKREIEELRNKLQESHSDHLEEEILDLRNTLLKIELERERMALELEEEKKDKAERERRLKEQIESLSTMVINSAVDDRDYDKRTKKNNRRETWCPRLPALDPNLELSELKKPFSKQAFDSVSKKHNRLLPLPPPFEKLSEEDESTWGSSLRETEETLGDTIPESNEESQENTGEFIFVDPGACMYVAERRRRSSTDRMVANEEELLDLQAQFQDLQCEHETAKSQMKKVMSENADLRRQLEQLEGAAKNCSQADGKFPHIQDGDRRCKSLDGSETEVSGTVLRKLQEQVRDFQIEKFYMQREIDNLMEQAKNQRMAANEQDLEQLCESLQEARQEALGIKEQLSMALEQNQYMQKERENDFRVHMDLAASFHDLCTEVEMMKANVAVAMEALESEIGHVKACTLENKNNSRLQWTLLDARLAKQAEVYKDLDRIHEAQAASARQKEDEVRSVKRKAEYDAATHLDEHRGKCCEKESLDSQLNLHAEHIHSLEAELAQSQNKTKGLIAMVEKEKEERNVVNGSLEILEMKLMSITKIYEAKLTDVESKFFKFSQEALEEFSQLQNAQESVSNTRALSDSEMESLLRKFHSMNNKVELLEANLLVASNEKEDRLLKLQSDIMKERDAFDERIEVLEKENISLAESNRKNLEELESLKLQTKIQVEQLELAQEKLEKVTEECMAFSTSSTTLSLQNQEQKNSLEELQMKLDRGKFELEGAVELKTSLFTEVESMKNLIVVKEERCQKLTDELAELEKEKACKVSELEEHLIRLRATLQQTQNEVEQYQGEFSQLRSEVVVLRKELSQAKAAPSALVKERDSIKKELEKVKSKVKDVEAKLKSTLQEKSKLEAEKANMDREVKMLRGQSNLLQRDINKRESLADKRRESVASGINKAKHQLSSAEHALQMKSVELEKANFDLQLLQESYARVEASLSEEKDFSELLEEKLASAEKMVVSLKEEKTNAEAKVERLAIELEAASEQWRLKNSELEAMRNQNVKLAEERQVQIAACHEAEFSATELSKVKDELTLELTDAYYHFEEEKAAWVAAKLAVENALSEENEAKNNALKEIDALKIDLEQMHQAHLELHSTKECLFESQEQISQAHSELESTKELLLESKEQIVQAHLELQATKEHLCESQEKIVQAHIELRSTKERLCELQEQIIAAENIAETERQARFLEASHAQDLQTLLVQKEADLEKAMKYEELFAQVNMEHKEAVIARASLDEKLTTVEKELESAKSEASMSLLQAEQLSKTIKLYEEQCKELEKHIIVLEANEKKFQERPKGCSNEQATINTPLNIKVCGLQEASDSEKKRLECQVVQLEEELVNEKKQVEHLKAMLIRAEEELSSLSELLSTEKCMMDELRARFSALKANEEQWILIRGSMEDENKHKQNQNDVFSKEITELLTKNLKLQVAFDAMAARAEVFEGRLEDARWDLIEIKEKASRLPVRHTAQADEQESEAKLAAAKLEIVELKVELQNSRHECMKYYNDLKHINEHLAKRDTLEKKCEKQGEDAVHTKAELSETEGDDLVSMQKVCQSSPAQSLAKRKSFGLTSVSSLKKRIKEIRQQEMLPTVYEHYGNTAPSLLVPCSRVGKSFAEPDHSEWGSTRRAALLPVDLNSRASRSPGVDDIMKLI